jgi:hypothetical protein
VITVTAGQGLSKPINFNVNPVSSPGVASVRTWSYTARHLRASARRSCSGKKSTIAAFGSGLTETVNTTTGATVPTPGLSVGMLGTAAQINNLRAYPPPNRIHRGGCDADFAAARTGASVVQHSRQSVRASLGIHGGVLAPPPLISALAPAVDGNGNPAVAIAGEQFTPSTQVWFDGVPAVIQSQSSNMLIVTPPAGA